MIGTSVTKQIYVGDGVTTAFPFSFPFSDVDYVKVSLYDIESGIETPLDSDYFVDAENSTVHYPGYPPGEEPPEDEQPPVLTSDTKIIIYRETPISQLEDLGEKYPLPTIEGMVDKNTMILQELNEEVTRAVKVKMGSDHTPDEFMDDIADAVQSAKGYADDAQDSADAADASVTKAAKWAEGSDADVSALGGTHSSKGWSDVSKGHSDDASGYATAASGSAAAASGHETHASYWAEGTDGQVTPLGGTHSAKGWAADSAASAASVVANVGKAQTWAEGSDADVAVLGGEHSSKNWAAEAKAWAMSMANLPVASIVPWGGSSNTPPVGFLFCDGSAVSRTMYPDLFAAIGTTWGAGDGSTTFNLPTSEDLVLQGASTTNPVGTYLSAGLPNIEGTIAMNAQSMERQSGAIYQDTSSMPNVMGIDAYASVGNLCFDASRSNSIYGNSTTVQPPAACVRFMIKAFDGQTPDSALIDITQYASDLANKADRSLSNLNGTGEDHFLNKDFTIIYPNGGSESSPANISNNTRYVETNPFPGYYVACMAEIFYDNEWAFVPFIDFYASGNGSSGISCAQLDGGNIVLQTGEVVRTGLANNYSGYIGSPVQQVIYSAPCRVRVFKIGKVANS